MSNNKPDKFALIFHISYFIFPSARILANSLHEFHTWSRHVCLLMTRLWKVSISHLCVLDWLWYIPPLIFFLHHLSSSPSFSMWILFIKFLQITFAMVNAHNKDWLVFSHQRNAAGIFCHDFAVFQDLTQKVRFSTWPGGPWALSSGLVSLLQP